MTSASLGKCATSVAGTRITSIKALNLPYDAAVSDKNVPDGGRQGFPEIITGRSKSEPIEVTATAAVQGKSFTCVYQATAIHALFFNKGSEATLTNQKFTRVSGSSLCPAMAHFTGRYGAKRPRPNPKKGPWNVQVCKQ